jgi:hypothetical protein
VRKLAMMVPIYNNERWLNFRALLYSAAVWPLPRSLYLCVVRPSMTHGAVGMHLAVANADFRA